MSVTFEVEAASVKAAPVKDDALAESVTMLPLIAFRGCGPLIRAAAVAETFSTPPAA